MAEFDPFAEETAVDEGVEEPRAPNPDLLKAAGLVPASSLLDPDAPPDEPAELGFEPDDRYLGFAIVPRHLWPSEPRHEHFSERFYVETVEGTLGMVPWPGSKIVWPWERAWQQDLHRTEVQSFLKDEKKKGK